MAQLADLLVPEGATLRTALEAMTRSGRQVALVVDRDRRLLGLMTDGDVRKALRRGVALDAKVEEVMNRTPVVAPAGGSRGEALTLMRSRSIRHVPVVDERRTVVDLLRLEDLLAPVPPLRSRAVIMAGGQGMRLRPLTESTPKPMLRVGGKPILELLIERLPPSGTDHRARLRVAGEGISDQRPHLRAPAFARVHAPAWTVLRRPGADQAPSRAGRARGGVRDPRVLARRRAPSRPPEGQPRRGRGAPGLTRIAVVGLGYVGLTLSVALAKKGVTVLGYDREPRVVGALQTGRPHLYEPGVAEELPALLEERLRVVPELPREPVDGAVLCVSTPVDPVTREPVLEPLRDAARAVAAAFDSDTLVVVRSPVPVGASRGV